jgi:hypothetical protein
MAKTMLGCNAHIGGEDETIHCTCDRYYSECTTIPGGAENGFRLWFLGLEPGVLGTQARDAVFFYLDHKGRLDHRLRNG